MTHLLIDDLFVSCPFLVDQVDLDDVDVPTVIFGQAARVLTEGKLAADHEDQIFEYFNRLAETGDEQVLEVLGTGAIELFNDDARSQKLARTKLKGRARTMLEDYRRYWGQPDYGEVA